MNGLPVGYLNTRWQQQLQADIPQLLRIQADGYHVHTQDWLHCADVLQNLGREWYVFVLFSFFFYLLFDVRQEQEALFALERSLFRPLGMISQAVHLNGFVIDIG